MRIQTTAQGTTRTLKHVVNNLEESISHPEESLVQSCKRLVDLTGQVDLPFEYAALLGELASRLHP